MPALPLTARREQGVQLVATLGPASFGRAADLAAAGATALRLNASHMTAAELAEALAAARGLLPVVVDLQGAKMRLGDLAARPVAAGERLRFTPAGELPLPHPELYAAARAGDTLTVDDGRLAFRVRAGTADALEVECLTGGVLAPRKGVNVVEHPVALADLTAADAARLGAAAGAAAAFAFSFMTDGREAAWIRRRAPGVPVVGKVERREAVAALGELAARVDALWICRGDLGAQLGPAALARFVAGLEPRRLPVPVLMAGQVLEHLTRGRAATRSEVCHLHDLLARGHAGIVLSDETAIGEDPVGAVAAAASLLAELA